MKLVECQIRNRDQDLRLKSQFIRQIEESIWAKVWFPIHDQINPPFLDFFWDGLAKDHK